MKLFSFFLKYLTVLLCGLFSLPLYATTFTSTVPGTGITLPTEYPQAGGVAMVYVGNNGNIYYQYSNPAGAFRGFNSNGRPAAFRGNPFTINNPLTLDCGFTSCTNYFGGGIAQMHIRFSAFDGDTQPGGFDFNSISLLLNGFNVGNWSNLQTEKTNTPGTVSQGFETGFGNNSFNTGWFNTTNQTLLNNILATGQVTTQVFDVDPNDNYWDFRRGSNLNNNDIVTVAPGYTISKTADRVTFAAVGELIKYQYRIENIGSVPITNLAVTDDKISNVECLDTVIVDVPSGTPSPDFAVCTGEYTVTQEDFDNQFVTNNATATGTPEFGILGVLNDSVTVTGPALNSSVDIEKTSTQSLFGAVGTSVNYSFKVTNDGNSTLTNVVVTDPLIPSLSCTTATLPPFDAANPTANVFTCNDIYTVTQTDVDNFATSGTQLTNTATVNAKDPNLADVTPATSVVQLNGPAAAPALVLAKAPLISNFSAANQVIQYEMELTNTGNVTFAAAPTLVDSLGIPVTCPAGPVAPNTTITCSASYNATQPDDDAGKIDNTVTTSITIGGVTANGQATATIPAVQTTGLTLDKRLTSASPTSYDASGIDLFYEYELTNTGNVTLENIVVNDSVPRNTATVPVSCGVTTLAPNASVICTSAAYSTVQRDVNRGSVVNEATATSTAAVSGTAVDSNTDTVNVPAVQKPEMELTKTAPVVAPLDFVAGNTITYNYAVKNTGNVRIATGSIDAQKITITDDKIGTFDCFVTPLNRNATKTCTADYTITATDVSAGIIVNVATANALDSSDISIVASNQAQATVAPSFTPSVSVVKTADVTTVDAITDLITYTFTVQNTGDSPLTIADNLVTINDAKISSVDCSAQPVSLAINDSFVCTGTYNPTQTELNNGTVDNMATASFPFTNAATGTTTTITSMEAMHSVGVTENLDIVFSKTPPTEFTSINEVISYGFSVQNTSNVTLTSVVVTDTKIPALVCTFTNVAPQATETCSGNYTVTQADVDEEEILNTASATGTSQTGGQVTKTDTGDVDITAAGINNSITVDKTANCPSSDKLEQLSL